MNPTALRIGAHIEFASLLIMLANLATVHDETVSSLMGPVHGCAYLFVVVGVWAFGRTGTAARVLALVPGIGGLLTVRRTMQALKRPRPVKEPQHSPVRRGQDVREG
ncbi:hypothetical protein [Nocardiopsis chromatogenes]|uniref:hypothetical protein n=1 Tax=Nocardiopsis chromatogenes TaxID=280239 RepID=UPI0006889A52|nr:hypothetical protein [Nocardiopsis chromatogenes]